MKLDINTDMNDLVKGPLCRRVTITLDGKEVRMCTVADEEEGYVIKYKEVDGRPFVSGGELQTECLKGVVKIVDPGPM